MRNKSIEDKFSVEIDAYFNGIEDKCSRKPLEYMELVNLGKELGDLDFSSKSNKENMFKKIIKEENRSCDSMKKSSRSRRIGTMVASLSLVGVLSIPFMQTSFAQDLVDKVIKTISLGRTSFTQYESPKIDKIPVPSEYKGKIFDKNGNPIEIFTEENAKEGMYTANGEKIAYFEEGKIITVEEEKEIEKNKNLIIKDANEINQYTSFKASLPTYLPEGYKFDRATFYKTGGEVKNSKYATLYFTNDKGKELYMQQRENCEETGSSLGTDGKIEEVKINGVDAVIVDNRSISWETPEVIYFLSGKGNINKDELIKVAESMK